MAFDDKPESLVKADHGAGLTGREDRTCRCQALAADVRELVAQYCPVRQGDGPDCIVDLLLAAARTQLDDAVPTFDQLH